MEEYQSPDRCAPGTGFEQGGIGEREAPLTGI